MSDQQQPPLLALAGVFMAGFAARELLARPQTVATVRKALKRVNPRAQATVEGWIAKGHEVMVQEGERQIQVWVRTKTGKVKEVVLNASSPIIDVDAE